MVFLWFSHGVPMKSPFFHLCLGRQSPMRLGRLEVRTTQAPSEETPEFLEVFASSSK